MIKRLFILANIGLLTLAAYFTVDLFYQVAVAELLPSVPGISRSPDTPTERAGRSGQRAAKTSRPRFSSYQAILDRNLFATVTESQAEKKTTESIQVDKLQETQLNLKLWGTVTGSGKKAYAVIEDKNKREQGLYRKGDSIQNATIKMILRKKVVLRANGKDEVLTMEDEKGRTAARAASRSGGGRAYDRGVDSRETKRLDRSKINHVLNNINRLMNQAKVRPYFKDGKPDGLLLTHIRRNSLFTDLGLKSGDIVKGVNGKRIRSVEDAMDFYNNLKNSSSVQLEIERRGETKSISYEIY
jgi:general secretion pathway protein C